MTWNLEGHDWAVHLLRGHLSRGELRHAYLFTGPPGVGRRTLALNFARAMNCQNPIAPGEPCGACRACVQIGKRQYTDLAIVEPETEAGALKVEQVRELQHTLNFKPYEGKYRVAILPRFQQANANAQNALLKTLEEAPAHVVLLLTADSAESLLPTIVSRCEVLRLRPMALGQLAAALTARGVDEAQARLFSHLCDGRLGAALRLLDDPDTQTQRIQWLDELNQLMRSNRRAKLAYADAKPMRERDHLRTVLQTWLTYWRDALLAAAGLTAGLVNLDRQDEIVQLAQSVGLQEARRQLSAIDGALVRLDANVNPRLLMEVVLLDLPALR